jgi:hypothetical protein
MEECVHDFLSNVTSWFCGAISLLIVFDVSTLEFGNNFLLPGPQFLYYKPKIYAKWCRIDGCIMPENFVMIGSLNFE